jgi:hypothetical protein
MQNVLKQYGLWVVLVLTLAATIWTSQHDDIQAPTLGINVPVLAAKRSNDFKEKMTINDEHSESTSRDFLNREEISENPSNLFSTFTTTENLPAVGIPEQVVVNPFIYAGKLVDEGKVTVFLIEGDKSHAVKVGNIIEELWKVKSITPPIMVLKNLSTKIEVQIEIGALS